MRSSIKMRSFYQDCVLVLALFSSRTLDFMESECLFRGHANTYGNRQPQTIVVTLALT
jgi:hypothetical protein